MEAQLAEPTPTVPQFPTALADEPRAPRPAAYAAVAGIVLAVVMNTLVDALQIARLQRAIAVARSGEAATLGVVYPGLLAGALLSLGALVLSGAAFMTWMFHARRNCVRLGVHPEWSQGWTIGGWFLPIGAVYVPCKVVLDIREASTPYVEDDSKHTLRGAPVGWWWAAFLLSNLLSFAALQVQSAPYTPGATAQQLLADRPVVLVFIVLDMLATVGAGILAGLVVLRITRTQEQYAEISQARGW